MDVIDWLASSGLAVAFLLVAGWVSRQFLTDWITASVKHSFEADIERLRADLRQEERKLEALSSGALANMSALQSANAERRVKAADTLWQAMEDCDRWTWAVVQISIIDFENASAAIESEPKLKTFFEMVGPSITQESLVLGKGANAARPYLSDLAWALFETYRGVTSSALLKLLMLKKGIDGRKFMNVSGASEMLKKALPEQASRIELLHEKIHPEMLQILREQILAEIRKTIDGKSTDADSVARAHEIVALAAEIRGSVERHKVQQPPAM